MHDIFEAIRKHPWIAGFTVTAVLGAVLKFFLDKLVLDGLRDLLFAAVGRWLGISDVNSLVALLSYAIPLALAYLIIWGAYRLAQHNAGVRPMFYGLTPVRASAPADHAYWTLCEAITWIAFGKTATKDTYSAEFLRETGTPSSEQMPAIRMAETALLASLQDETRMTAYGKEMGRGQHKKVPFTYFLSVSAGMNPLNDAFQLSTKTPLEEILTNDLTQWSEVRLPRADVLKLWPRRLYVPLAVVRDVSVDEAIAYICFGAWGRKFFDAANSPEVSGSREFNQFQQAAADGEVPVWGRLSKARLFEPIDKEFWRKNRIEWFGSLKGEPHTEQIERHGTQPRYIDLMTSRAETERLFRSQPPELQRAKSIWRRLSILFNEGVDERNKVLHDAFPESDAGRLEGVLQDWDARVLSALGEAAVREVDRSDFETLNLFEPVLAGGEPDRQPWQLRLEAIWNENLRRLRIIRQGLEE